MTESDDDIALPPAGPRFYPDPACPECDGRGVVQRERGRFECRCLLRQRALHYLTPTYARPTIPWDRDFDPKPHRGKNVLIENSSQLSLPKFESAAYGVVKSFLLTTGMRLSHRTLTPYEVFRRLFDAADTRTFDELSGKLDLLILFFGGDPANKDYEFRIPWLIRTRRDHGVATWILTAFPLTGSEFKRRYPGLSDPLNEALANDFIKLPLSPAHTR